MIAFISIHAPARGATKIRCSPFTLRFGFQSTLPRGERRLISCYVCRTVPFQSTLPRGERLPYRSATSASGNFNPRSREGSDISAKSCVFICTISIHAPARGATFFNAPTFATCDISIHAPARGATLFYPRCKITANISIHAPARGATIYSWCRWFVFIISIHAPARGATGLQKVD